MTTFIAILVLVSVVAGVAGLLERNQHRLDRLPHQVAGAAGVDLDLERVVHEVDATRAHAA